MLSIFLSHQWKDFWRSRNKAGSIAAQIVLGLFMLYFLAIAIGAGIFMGNIIEEFYPGSDPVYIFSSILLYYFMAELAMRFQLQEIPTLSVIPYLHLNIRKSKIVKFLNIRSLFSFFNLLPIFIFTPFCITHVGQTNGFLAAFALIISILAITFFINFLVLYIKRKSISNVLYFAVALAIVGVMALLDFYHIISIRPVSAWIFGKVMSYPAVALAFIALAAGMFLFNSAYLYKNLYVEELGSRTKKKASTEYAFLNRFGKVGELAALELKLILRHKRSKSSLMMGFFFLFYGFIFYKQPMWEKDEFGKMIFAAIFMTGISIISYGQFMFAWQSAHFDGLLVSKINFRDFIKAKFLLFTIACTIVTLLASFYGFLSPKLLLLHLAAYLYNIGFGTVLVLYFATMNYKRLDITKSASFNWQGTGATQWIMGFPFILIPILIYVPFGILNRPYTGLLVLGSFGLIMLFMRGFWVNYLTNRFEKQRYKIAEGFRE